jgi:hypothetical protein
MITQFTDTLVYSKSFPGTLPHYVKYVAYTFKIAHFPHFYNCLYKKHTYTKIYSKGN